MHHINYATSTSVQQILTAVIANLADLFLHSNIAVSDKDLQVNTDKCFVPIQYKLCLMVRKVFEYLTDLFMPASDIPIICPATAI